MPIQSQALVLVLHLLYKRMHKQASIGQNPKLLLLLSAGRYKSFTVGLHGQSNSSTFLNLNLITTASLITAVDPVGGRGGGGSEGSALPQYNP